MLHLRSTIHDLRSTISRGFTLIELLVVIAIIGILITVGSVSYTRAVKLSRDAKRKTDLEQIRQALETYRAETGSYPTAAAGGTGTLDPDYITLVPTAPDGASYPYTPAAGATPKTYSLCATFEITTPSNYCVSQP
jgi:type II secretion system protein G